MQTFKLTLEYEGTRYRGWQIQTNARTVQGELASAARDFFQTKIDIGGAGRTDAGVHALAQVAHLRVTDGDENLTPRKIQFGLNDRLPHDINILRIENAANDFHARHDAISRQYLYRISTRRNAFAKTLVWWVKDDLNVSKMSQAAKLVVGKHDFRSYCDQEDKEPTIVVVKDAAVTIVGDEIHFRISASHFLWKMVRRIVGVLVEVGRGKYQPEAVNTFLNKKSEIPAKLTAPPSGLYLQKILYKK